MDSNTILDKSNKGALSAEGKALAMRIAKERPPNADHSANVYGLPTVEPDESSMNEEVEEERGAQRRKPHKGSKKVVEREGLLTSTSSSEEEDDEGEQTASRKKRVGSKSYHSLANEKEEGSVAIDGDEFNDDVAKKKKRTAGGGSSKTNSSKGSAGRGRGRGSSSHAGSSSRASSSSHSPMLNESRSGAPSPKNENDSTDEQSQQVKKSAQKGSMPPRSGGSGSGVVAGGDSSSDLVGIADKRRSASVFSQASQSIMNLLSNSSLINKSADATQASNAAAMNAVAPAGPDIELQIETTSSVVFRIIFYGWYLLLILAIVLQVIVNIQWDCKNVCGQECGLLSLGDWRSGSCSDVKTTTVNEHTFDENNTAINVTRTVYDLTWEGSVGYVADDRLNRFVHVVVVMPRPNVTNLNDDLRYDLRFALNVSNTADNEDGIKFGEVVAVATLHCDGGKSRCHPVILNTNIAQAATNASSLSIVISDAPKPLADVASEAGVAYVFQHSQYTIGTLVVRYTFAFFSLIHLIRFIYHKPVHGLYEQTWVIILHFALFLYLDPLFAGGVYLRPAPSIFSFIEFRVPIYFIATFVAFMFSVITSAHAWASDDSSLVEGGGAPSPTTAELYDPPLRTKLIAVSYVAVIVVLDILDGYLHNWDWSDEHCPNFECTVPGFALYILLGLGVLVCTCWLWWLRGNLGQKPYFACRAQQLAFRIFVIVFISAVFYLVMQTILVFAIYNSISALISFQILIQIGPILVMVAFVNVMTYVYTSTLRTGKGEKGDREKGVPIRPMDPTWKETVWEERWYRWLALHGGSMYMFVSEAEEQLFDFIQSQGALRKDEARRYEDSRDSQGGGFSGGGGGGSGSGNVFKNMVSHFRSSMSPHSPRRDSRTRLPSYYDGEMVYTVPEWKLDKDLTPFERLVREYEIKLAMKRKADMERAVAERLASEEGFEVVSGEGGVAGDFGYDISEPPTPRENDNRRSSSSSSSSASTAGRGSRGRRVDDGYAEDDDDANSVSVGVLRSTSNERNYDSTEDYRPPPRPSSSTKGTSKRREGSSSTKKKGGGGPLSPTYSTGGKKIRRGGAASPAFSSSASPRRGAGSGRTPNAHGKKNGRWSSGSGGGGTDNNGNPFRTVANFGKGVMNTIVEAPNTLGEGIARIEDGFMAMGYALGGQTAVPRKPFFNLETCVDLFNLSWEVYGRPTPAEDLYLITDAGSTSTGRKAPGVDEVTKPWYKRVLFCIKWGDEGEVEDDVDFIKKYSTSNNNNNKKGSNGNGNGLMVDNDITASLAQYADGGEDVVASSPNGGGGPGDTAFLSITHGSARGLTNEMSISAGDPANKTMPLRPINNITRVPLAGGAEKHFSSEQKGASGLGVNNASSHANTSSSKNNSIERNKTVGSAQQVMATRSQSQSPTAAEAAAVVDQTPPICSEQYGYELVAVHEALDVQTIICVMDTDVGVHRGKVPRIVVAFRGSTNLSNFEQDVRFTRVRWTEMPARSALSDKWVGPTVHQGFLNVWSALRHFVLTEVQELHRHLVEKAGPNGPTPQVYLTGHSLGGAIATLCAYAMKKTLRIEPIVYTFGAPIVGNKGFKDEYNREIRRTFRIVNESDMVVSLTQFGGHHVGIEAAIDRMGNFICEPMFIERWLRPTQGKGFAAQNHLMGAYGASLNAIIKQGRFGRCPIECQKSYFEPHERSTIMSIASRRRMHEMRLQEKESGAYDAVLHETIGAFKSSGVYSSSATYSSPVNTSGYYDYYNNNNANKHNTNSKNNNSSPYGSPTNGGGVYADPSNNRYSTSSTSALLPAPAAPPSANTRSQTYYSADHVGKSTAGGANRYTGYRY